MARFLLDSRIASGYIDRRNGVFHRARAEVQNGNRVGIAVPVLAELASGIERSRSRDRNMDALRLALGAFKLWPFDEGAAFEYGRLHAELLRIGRPMQTIDIMIAAIARAMGDTVVVSKDSDLAAVTRVGRREPGGSDVTTTEWPTRCRRVDAVAVRYNGRGSFPPGVPT